MRLTAAVAALPVGLAPQQHLQAVLKHGGSGRRGLEKHLHTETGSGLNSIALAAHSWYNQTHHTKLHQELVVLLFIQYMTRKHRFQQRRTDTIIRSVHT